MNYIGRVFSNFKEFYNDINPATLTGAIDVIVVQQEDGSYMSSPFHVRFGKMGVLRSKEKIVDIEVNGLPINVHMKLGESGEAFFVEEVPEEEKDVIPSHLATSPLLPMPKLEEEIKLLHQMSLQEAEDCNNLDVSVQTEIKVTADTQDEDDSSETRTEEDGKDTLLYQDDFKSKKRRKKRQPPRKRSRSNEQVNRPIEQEIFLMDEDLADEGVEGMTHSASLPIQSFAGPVWRATGSGQHPFSDGDITPPNLHSPKSSSRPYSPKSDSEVEIGYKNKDATSQTDQVSWHWGELPTLTDTAAGELICKVNDTKEGDNKKSYLGSVFDFMRANKNIPHHSPQNEGIFLDDLKLEEMEPEEAALYFPRYKSPNTVKDEDTESGNGQSLPQSPSSHESDPEDNSTDVVHKTTSASTANPEMTFGDLAFSLCGGLLDSEEQLSPTRFNQFSVGFDEYAANPTAVFSNPKLVVRMDGKFYNWQTAAPILMSMALFQKQLPENAIGKLINSHMPKKRKNYSWWYWGSRDNKQPVIPGQDPQLSSPDPSNTDIKQLEGAVEELKLSESPLKELTDSSSSELLVQSPEIEKKEKYRKSLRMTSDQLENLDLKRGQNEVIFSVTTAYQGTARCKCNLFLWRYDEKVVISDIDGTITKSDVLGHILPIIGNDWAHSGVTKLFSTIYKNGYNVLYLSARAIGQAHTTREYLRGLRQGELCLPDGPLLLNPTSLLSALHREVIEKKPEVFKINCLRDIQTLYPKAYGNPFYAGFGNKINDTWAYCSVAVPAGRIFTINHRGELRLAVTHTFQSSYLSLSDVVDQVFPPYAPHNVAMSEEFSSFTFWRYPIPELAQPPVVAITSTPPSK